MVALSHTAGSLPSFSPHFVGPRRCRAGSPADLASRIKTTPSRSPMPASSEVRVSQSRQSSGAVAPERIFDFLRCRHPQKTADNVAAETGISRETIHAWFTRGSAPSWSHMAVLILVYGPDFLAAALPARPAWLDGAAREARRTALEAEIAARQAELDALRSAT